MTRSPGRRTRASPLRLDSRAQPLATPCFARPGARPFFTVTTAFGKPDLGHRLTSVTYPNLIGQGPVTATGYVYDGGGRRHFRRDDYGMARYTYDSLGRLTQVVSPQENSAFAYDAAGNQTGVGYSLGTVSYAYEADNRLTTITDPLGNATTYNYANYRYDYTGNVRDIAVTWNQSPSSYTLTATYDTLYRMTQWKDTSVSDANLQTYYYAYDAAGNRLQWGNQNNAGVLSYVTPKSTTVTMSSAYDAANRVSQQQNAMRDNWRQLTPGSQAVNVTQEPNGNAVQDIYWYQGSTESFDAILNYTFNHAAKPCLGRI